MILVYVATVFALKFPGGTPNEFVGALAQSTRQNVVMSQGTPQPVSKVAFQDATLTEMARALRAQAGHAIMPGSEMVLSDQLLPYERVTGGGFQNAPGNHVRVSFEGIQNFKGYEKAKVDFVDFTANKTNTFKTEKDQALQLQRIRSSDRKISVHWFYAEAPLYVDVKDLPELDLYQWIAKAEGAKLAITEKAYDFQLDPDQVRNRAIATLTKLMSASKDEYDQGGYRFRIACLKLLTQSQIKEALATPYSSIKIELRDGTPFANLAVARIREMEKRQSTYGPNTRASQAAVGLLPRIDTDRPAYLFMDAKFYTRMEVPYIGPDGKREVARLS